MTDYCHLSLDLIFFFFSNALIGLLKCPGYSLHSEKPYFSATLSTQSCMIEISLLTSMILPIKKLGISLHTLQFDALVTWIEIALILYKYKAHLGIALNFSPIAFTVDISTLSPAFLAVTAFNNSSLLSASNGYYTFIQMVPLLTWILLRFSWVRVEYN